MTNNKKQKKGNSYEKKYGVVTGIEYGQTSTTTAPPTKTIDLDGQKITVAFPIVFESESEDDVVQSRFTIMEPNASGKVEVYFERITEALMHRFKVVLEQLMDKFDVKSVNITTRNELSASSE